MWDAETPSEITRARLLRMPPHRVYDELREYGASITSSNRYGIYQYGLDSDMERALQKQSDPLINLGLAQFGGTGEVLSAIYKQSFADTKDTGYNHAIRLAVLGNLSLECSQQSNSPLNDSELLRLACTAGTEDCGELGTLLRNPGVRWLIASLFNREPPFDQVVPEHFYWMLRVAAQNPCINRNDEAKLWSDSPDLSAYDLQHGIWKLVRTLPVNRDSRKAMKCILDRLELQYVHTPSEDPTAAIIRWGSLQQGIESRDRLNGTRTLLRTEKFCCLVAALYGKWHDSGDNSAARRIIGSAGSQNFILRCAYYGNAVSISADQMRQMYDKDGEAFTLAALCNQSLVGNPMARAVFEDSGMLGTDDLRYLYDLRYKEVVGAKSLQEQDNPTPALETVARIESGLARITAALELQSGIESEREKSEWKRTWWALALLVLILFVVWLRH